MAKNKKSLAEVFPPSTFILEEMEERGWSIETLASKMLVTPAYLEPILANKRYLTKGACVALARAFDTGPEYWENLQTLVNENIAAAR